MTENLAALFHIPVDPTYQLSLCMSIVRYHVFVGFFYNTTRKIISWEETSCNSNNFQKLLFFLTWFAAFSRRKIKTKIRLLGLLLCVFFPLALSVPCIPA